MSTAAEGDLECMGLLLEHGANPNARNERNEVPLGFACSYEQWPAVELLVQHGADVNGIEDEGKTHLDYLMAGKKERGIQLMRELGGVPFDELDSNHGA